MKTILAPTDFSAPAENAVNYALELAKVSGAKVILYHASHLPFVDPNMDLITPSIEELEKSGLADLEMVAEQLRTNHHREVEIECKFTCGFAVDEINRIAEENQVDLIVMGMQGAGYLAERLLGSVTTSLSQASRYPVLAVNETEKFRAVKRLALAVELNQTITDMNLLQDIATLFNTHVYLVNVVEDLTTVPSNPLEITDFGNLSKQLDSIQHSFHFAQGTHVAEGMNNFINEMNCDLAVIIAGKHSLLGRLFHEPNAKRMVFHGTVPVLILNQDHKS